MIEIEKDVPLAPRFYGSGRTMKYPWEEMEVGDSFLVVGYERPGGIVTNAHKRYAPKRFTTRKVDGGIRVWRIK